VTNTGTTPSGEGTSATNCSAGGADVWLEAECAGAGPLWNSLSDANASNGQYLTVQSGNNSTGSAPGTDGQINYNFSVSESGTYKVWARVITPNADDDSFWVRMDGGSWTLWNNIPSTSTWQWDDVHDSNNGGSVVSYNLSSGNHTLTIGYREDGAQLDKVLVTNTGTVPSGEGTGATNCNSGNIVVRALGVNGDETIELRVDSTTVATWTLTTSMADYTASGNGVMTVHFTNDDVGRDVQIDYVTIDGTTYQSEDQTTNTGVWQDSSCGGSNSEWLNCNGYIEYASTNPSSRTALAESERPTGADITSDVVIYPNPSYGGMFSVTLPENMKNSIVNIFDNNGRLIFEKVVNDNGTLNMDTKLKTGIYLVKIMSEELIINKKLIVR